VISRSEAEELVVIALAVAREAGALVESGWRRSVHADHKGPVDLVTAFDRTSEELLRERLHARTAFPVVGEERGADAGKQGSAVRWYVDPIDGTTNFVHGHPFYCVSVGLLGENDAPVLGAIVAPSLRTEWAGIAGAWATRNGEACRVSRVDRFIDALLATGFPYDRHTSDDNNFDAFVAIKKRCQAVRRCGSAALDMCLVADSTYDGYWEKKLGPWDIAAGAAIVLGAGGRISGFDGGDAQILSGSMVATNGAIHGALLGALAGTAAPAR